MKAELHWRLEPQHAPQGNLQRGFQAELGDPLWLLGRQWQMGEHEGENASTPIRVEVSTSDTPMEPPLDRAGQDPRIIPAEAIVEGEEDEWWTLGRRIAIGLRAVSEGRVPPIDEADPALLLRDLPQPYQGLSGKVYDGRALARNAAFDLRSLVPSLPPRSNHWLSDELAYRTSFRCGNTVLRVDRHDGGDVDWWTVDAARPLTETAQKVDHSALPNRFKYPGAPHPRFWQIEDRHVDIGGFPPDRSHFATLLLIDLIASHSDDWFTFPLLTRTGHVLSLHDVQVIDSFGDRWPAPGARWEPQPPDEWAMFRVRGLDPPVPPGALQAIHTLALWPTAATPLAGPALEDVVLGVDEDANLLWAVEQRMHGMDTVQPPPDGSTTATTVARMVYRPTSDVPHHWHPYEIAAVDTDASVPGRRRFVQGRFAHLRTDGISTLRPAPRAELLAAPEGIHEIEPAAVPTTGLRLKQQFMLARGTDARPVLWLQRQRLPLLGPPSHALRFDVANPVTARRAAPLSDQPPPPQVGPPPPPDDALVKMVRPPEPAEPDLTPTRAPISDPPLDTEFDPAALPELSPNPAVADPHVLLAQALLNAAGALPADGVPLIADGRFGPRTGEAISALQTTNRLAATGKVDVATWMALLRFSPFAVLLPGNPAPAGPPIARAQSALNRIGARPRLDITGALDDSTSAALRDFQTSKFLVPSGGLDLGTWLALEEAERETVPEIVMALDFEYDAEWYDNGQPLAKLITAWVLDQRPVAITPPGPRRDHSGYWLELWDGDQVILYRQGLPDIIPLRIETYGETSSIHVPSVVRGHFSVAFPKVPRSATLALFGPRPHVNRWGEPSRVIFTFDLTTL
jgi:peptidoglycan hydrolase-like protein with peptidoglycan-binding domain